MAKGLPEKARVAVSKYRKTAMMSAAATALMAAAPAFAAAPGTEESLQATIRNILRTPAKEMSWRAKGDRTPATQPRFSAISIDNSDDISVGADESAVTHTESVEDINVVNTGNLTGGIGIEVSTGAVDFTNAYLDATDTYSTRGGFAFLYDDSGNYVDWDWTADVTYNTRITILNSDPAASTITIDNAGSIDFSGRHGIKATNPAGQSITISSSGDITHTAELTDRFGIYAVTESIGGRYAQTLTQAGEFTYNAYGQLSSVIARDQISSDKHYWDMLHDAGSIEIHNTGDIDMGIASDYPGYGHTNSTGIFARGDGGTTIVNEGHITVGKWSNGIRVASNGNASITNAGRIDVGNSSSGILFDRSYGGVEVYRLGGDVYVLNTGDIFGGGVKGDTMPGEYTDVAAIRVVTQGSNSVYGVYAEMNELLTRYNDILGEDYFSLYDIPNTRLYATTVVNEGRIEMLDGAKGIFVIPKVGDSTAINSGTIIVGEGTPYFRGNDPDPAAGIYQNDRNVDGQGLLVSINTASGVIMTGNSGNGLSNETYRGDSVVINEGVIVTGDGAVGQIDDYGVYDKLFHANGMLSKSADYFIGTTAYARNSGSITVGDLAIGSTVVGNGFTLLDPSRITALNVNEGMIASGDNSAGMYTFGTNATTVNTGDISSGSYDISGFTTNSHSAIRFAVGRNGAASTGVMRAEVFNDGTISTGDGKVGASAQMYYSGLGYGARVLQGETGVITTGDDAIGARVSGNMLSMFSNDGRISVGDNSVGAEITGGGVVLYAYETTPTVTDGWSTASNTGIIETGDDSVGVRMTGIREDVAWHGGILLPPDDEHPYYHYEQLSGTEDVNGASYLANSGTIRVGANSTAVEISGTAASERGLHLLNAGILDAHEASSTAVRVNADNALGSYVVNLGTIAGNVTFGTGDDHLINTVMTGDGGQVTSSGNIVMNGTTIDFGAGTNRFDNASGMITIAGGNNLITGADMVMTHGSIEARNNAVDSTLTINGNVSGDFMFGADFNGSSSDQLIVTGDVADGSSMSVVLNPTQQLSGETSFTVISIGGENNADDPVIAGVTGKFADSLLGAEIDYSEGTGEVTVTARFGMGHMATSASAATTMAQDWWMQSVGSFDKRNLQQLAGLEDAGISAWASVFQEEGSVDPANDLQDVGFDQKLTGVQTGIEWQGKVAGGSFNIGPMFSYGNASANQDANLSSAMGDATAYGLNAGYRFGNGVYVNATWQQMAMAIDFRTPGTTSNAIGSTDAEGDGFNVELGYAHKLQSGLTFAPQLQYASVSVDLDEFETSDGVYELTGLGGKHSLLRAGLSMFKTFETTNGSITPLVDLSYLDAMDGESDLTSNGVTFGNDSSGSGYRAELGVAGRYKGWDIAGRVGFAETAALKSALSSNLTVRYRW